MGEELRVGQRCCSLAYVRVVRASTAAAKASVQSQARCIISTKLILSNDPIACEYSVAELYERARRMVRVVCGRREDGLIFENSYLCTAC